MGFQADYRATYPMTQDQSSSRHAVAIVVFEHGKFLVIRRSEHVRAPGKVCFPGGHLEPSETERDAVAREMLEELRVDCEPRALVWRSQTSWGANVAWWTAERISLQEAMADPAEVAEVLWLTAEEMFSHPDLLESNRIFLESLERGEISLRFAADDTAD